MLLLPARPEPAVWHMLLSLACKHAEVVKYTAACTCAACSSDATFACMTSACSQAQDVNSWLDTHADQDSLKYRAVICSTDIAMCDRMAERMSAQC